MRYCDLVAARGGNASAQVNLGVMYTRGRGVPQDFKEAVSWYRKAAMQGDVVAQFNLGVMYFNGQGVAKDYSEAMSWYWVVTVDRMRGVAPG